MWELDKQDGASFRVSGWRLQVAVQPQGVQLIATEDASAPSIGSISLLGDKLPAMRESFIRGDELHLSLPPNEQTKAGIDLALLIVLADRDCLVVESTLALQTLLLDAHPTIELGVPGDGAVANHSHQSALIFAREGQIAKTPREQLAVRILIDERDQLSLDRDYQGTASVGLFGEFMEKGVIRKAQPWWVWTSGDWDTTRMHSLVAELAQRPLPLAN